MKFKAIVPDFEKNNLKKGERHYKDEIRRLPTCGDHQSELLLDIQARLKRIESFLIATIPEQTVIAEEIRKSFAEDEDRVV